MNFLISLIFTVIGGMIGYYLLPYIYELIPLPWNVPEFFVNPIVNSIVGALIFYLLSIPSRRPIKKFISKTEEFIKQVDIPYLVFGVVGAVIGLLLATLINAAIGNLNIPIIADIVPAFIAFFFGIFGFRFATVRKEDIQGTFESFIKRRQDRALEDLQEKMGNSNDLEEGRDKSKKEDLLNFRLYKVLDTSVIIDGRILDIVKTGFIEGTLVISDYVLRELQQIADSSDPLKRERGRRGLDVLNDLQQSKLIPVEINHESIDEVKEVDQKLVLLAKKLNGQLVTNDYNLNKVAEFQNVSVLNINDLANAVKPVVVPGETMTVTIVKEGTERDQGVGYLSDGTMIVVEDGKHHIDETHEVVVTSSLQTSAGRMIFAKFPGT